jgi:protein SCO1/2
MLNALGILVVVLLLATTALCSAARWGVFGSDPATAPDFTLVDQDGRPFTLSKLRGAPIALFFGFTHCPDECPTTLAHLAKALHAPGVPADTRVAFITVDPARDSPALLKRYVGLFDRRFVGLTGVLRDLTPVYAAYHMPRKAARIDNEHGDDSFEHGTTVYYIGRDGTIKGSGSWDDAPEQMAQDFRSFQ